MKRRKLNYLPAALMASVVFVLLLLSCKSDKKSSINTSKIQASAEIKPVSLLVPADEAFLVKAAEINLAEIRLGRLAQQKSIVPEIIELGRVMEEEHTVSFANLKTLANSKKVIIPATAGEKAVGTFSTLNGKPDNDFDKAYSSMMVTGHEKAISLFEKAVRDCTDKEVKSFAAGMLTSLRTQLAHSLLCARKIEKIPAT